jgi:hypothetical protein
MPFWSCRDEVLIWLILLSTADLAMSQVESTQNAAKNPVFKEVQWRSYGAT